MKSVMKMDSSRAQNDHLYLKRWSQVGPFAVTFLGASALEDSSALSFPPTPKRKLILIQQASRGAAGHGLLLCF